MRLYNTFTRKDEEFEPIEDRRVGMYTCGPTVYGHIHIGNFRTYITSDILRRALSYQDYEVNSVMNITDVGHMRYSTSAQAVIDPIMEEARRLSLTPLELSERYTKLFIQDSKKLHILPPTTMPKASEHVPEMIAIIKILMEKGFAYEKDSDVYFSVKKFRDYGKLSGNTLDKMDDLLKAVRISVETDKKDSADFALWKAKGDRVLEWDSPWGRGVPGWHIECSAMSIKYLGDTFDIHGGGEDLIFPHNEDEIAQSEAATNAKFVNYWVHSTYLTVEGEKMSRSKGNIFTLTDLEDRGFRPLSFRYLTFLTHYQTRMNLTWEGLASAQIALERLYEVASALGEPGEIDSKLENKFFRAITNNLDMPRAISIMWELLRSKLPDSTKAATLYKMDEVLGLDIKKHAKVLTNIPDEIIGMAKAREALRRQKKFHRADQLRAKIEKRGYIIKDEDKGTKILRKT